MAGYAVHLEASDGAVFDRHRDHDVAHLGFSPGDVTRVVRRRIAADGERTDGHMRRAQRLAGSDRVETARATVKLLQSFEASRHWEPQAVAADSGIDAGQVRAMLAFFATEFGSQPNFRSPTEPNVARTRPCIDLGTGVYFVPDPWAPPPAVHPRLAEAAAEDPNGPPKRYRTHREKAHQRSVAGVFRKVFGPKSVLETQHDTSEADGPGEIDVLVRSEWPLIVEAKARGLTVPGRRGAPARVATVTRDVVDKALEQTQRARSMWKPRKGVPSPTPKAAGSPIVCRTKSLGSPTSS